MGRGLAGRCWGCLARPSKELQYEMLQNGGMEVFVVLYMFTLLAVIIDADAQMWTILVGIMLHIAREGSRKSLGLLGFCSQTLIVQVI